MEAHTCRRRAIALDAAIAVDEVGLQLTHLVGAVFKELKARVRPLQGGLQAAGGVEGDRITGGDAYQWIGQTMLWVGVAGVGDLALAKDLVVCDAE